MAYKIAAMADGPFHEGKTEACSIAWCSGRRGPRSLALATFWNSLDGHPRGKALSHDTRSPSYNVFEVSASAPIAPSSARGKLVEHFLKRAGLARPAVALLLASRRNAGLGHWASLPEKIMGEFVQGRADQFGGKIGQGMIGSKTAQWAGGEEFWRARLRLGWSDACLRRLLVIAGDSGLGHSTSSVLLLRSNSRLTRVHGEVSV